jgi:hypothetical protein
MSFPLVPKFHLGTHLSAKLRFVQARGMRSRYRVHETHAPHFITATVVAWLPVFDGERGLLSQ